MKVSEQKKKLSQMSKKELSEQLASYRRELFGAHLNSATAHVKDYSQFKKLRRNIARVLTFLNQVNDKIEVINE